MKLGIYGGNVRRGQPLSSLVDEIVQMESQGFSSYWCPQVGTFDALTMIALAGPQTNTIELGTAVVPSYPRHPNALAQQAATTNALTGGRLILGVGPSHAPGIEALGLEYSRPARHMREYVTILKALGDEGRVEFDGEMYKMTTGFACPEASPFPVVMSALAPLMLKAAGEVADGTVTWMVGNKTIPRRASLWAYRCVYTTTTNKQSHGPCRSSKATDTCPTIDANSTLKGSTKPAKSPWLETNPKSKRDYKNFLIQERRKLLQAFTPPVTTVVLRLLEPTNVLEACWRLDTISFRERVLRAYKKTPRVIDEQTAYSLFADPHLNEIRNDVAVDV